MKKITLLVMSVAMLALGSCKKDDDNNPTPSTSKTGILIAKPWKETARTISPAIDINGKMVTDLYAEGEECDNDDIYKFNADKTYVAEEGATKCNPADPQVWDTGTWSFNADETQLIVNSLVQTNYNILSISGTKATLSYVNVQNGVSYTTTIVYTAQ